MLIDTHCHFHTMVLAHDDDSFSVEARAEIINIIAAAKMVGVTKFVDVGTNSLQSQHSLAIANLYEEVFASLGIHPNNVLLEGESGIEKLTHMLNQENSKVVAVGECGIDKHYASYDLPAQQRFFRKQIELALQHDLPIIVHSRDARDETLACIKEYAGEKKLRGVIHCFSEDTAWAEKVLEHRFMLGIGGTVTYPKNERLRDAVRNVGLDYLVLETDAPYLPVQSMRGKKNYPQHIADIALYIADLIGVDVRSVAEKTTSNATRLFSW